MPKLSPKFYGTFKVLKRVGQVACTFELPVTSMIDPARHVSRLMKRLYDQDNP